MKWIGGVILMLVAFGLIGCNGKPVQLWEKEQPLVSKELIYDEDGNLLEVLEYYYDEHNRYNHIINTQYDVESGIGVVFRKFTYIYKKNKYYEDITYPTHDNITIRNVYDEQNNLIKGEYIFDNNCHTATYDYEYKKDQLVCKCYGENKQLVFTSMTSYNEKSDEIFYFRENNDGHTLSISYQYEYDSDGNVKHKNEKSDSSKAAGASYSETEYVYDENGHLVLEMKEQLLNADTGHMELKSSTKILYFYDDEGRLIKKVNELKGERFDNKYTVIYEY